LFSAKPVVLHGRYTTAASGTIKLRGKVGGQDYVREIAVNLPENEAQNNVLATLWARTKVDDLLSKSTKYDSEAEEQYLDLKAKTKLDITALGLKYNLLTEFTSFVAVEEKIRTAGGKTRKVEVPVESTEAAKQLKQFQPGNDPYGYLVQITAGRRNKRGSGSGNGSGGGSMARPFANITSLSLSVSQQMPEAPPKTVSGGVINGKATNLVKPPYPPAAKAVRASGAVNIQVIIDESGNVISATAVSGHPLLRAAAEAAARNSKFAPTMMSGQAVKVTGVIVYNFVDAQNSAEPTVGEMSVDENSPEVKKTPLSPEMIAEQSRLERERLAEQARLEKERLAAQQRAEQEAKYRQMLAEKLHFWVFAAFERLQKGQLGPAENETKFVREGFADVEIRLTAKTPETLEKLKSAGFEIVSADKAKIVTGKVSVGKLSKLAEIAEVQYIFPNLK
jgi:TonB family protein